MSDAFFRRLADKGDQITRNRERDESRAQAILDGCNPVQRRFILDPSQQKALRCPRRSGKSFALTSAGLYLGESFPGKRILIVSLTLKSTKENFWSGAPGGLFKQNYEYGLNLKFNHTDLVWWHENGSRGRLAGAETRADIEYLRGAAAEADIVVVDECKSFAPEHLDELIRDVLEPGLMTRNGVIVLSGTPGLIPMGPFFEATSPLARNAEGKQTCTEFNGQPSSELWSLHSWTILDNLAAPAQWKRALKIKERRGWSDDHPSWRREYLGEWTTDSYDLVYAYASCRANGNVSWYPDQDKTNPTGLPEEHGPWHLVMGLDFGYEDDCAVVMAGWSEHLQELRHVADFKSPHLTVDAFADEVLRLADRFGAPEVIVADVGGLGKMVIETINQRYGWGVQPAEKKEKFDHIELVNSDFHTGRIKIIPGSDLEHELCGLQWDLSNDTKAYLARTGKLREDPSCPNHLCDALLYLWRYCYHFWATDLDRLPDVGTPEWYDIQEQKAIERAVARKNSLRNDPFGFSELRKNDGRLGESPWHLQSKTFRN